MPETSYGEKVLPCCRQTLADALKILCVVWFRSRNPEASGVMIKGHEGPPTKAASLVADWLLVNHRRDRLTLYS